MTNEIETTKLALYGCLDRIRRAGKHRKLTAEFEERLEEHLEEFRKLTERLRGYGQKYLSDLTSMREERDQIQQRLHAIDHAYNEQQKAMGIAGEELIRVQGVARQYLDDCRSAEKHSDEFSEKLRDAQSLIGHQEQLIVGQRLAIADLYMGLVKPRRRTLAQIKAKECFHSSVTKNVCDECGQIIAFQPFFDLRHTS